MVGGGEAAVKVDKTALPCACSFVNKDVGDFELVGGVPALKIKDLR